jgi:glycosyltransferase involved in cell wall biosynthesis
VWKGQEVAIRATHIIKKTMPHICCLLVGGVAEEDRAYQQRLQQICAELELEDNVVFTGFQKNPIDFMNMMDVIIHPSISPEPFGIVNLEAMLVRKPVISTTIGAPVEIFENGVSGVLVEPNDPDALAVACINILKEPNKAKQLGEAAYSRLKSIFTIQKMVDQNEAVYHRLLYSTLTNQCFQAASKDDEK